MTQNVAVQNHIALSALPQNTKRYNVEGLHSGEGNGGPVPSPPLPPMICEPRIIISAEHHLKEAYEQENGLRMLEMAILETRHMFF